VELVAIIFLNNGQFLIFL